MKKNIINSTAEASAPPCAGFKRKLALMAAAALVAAMFFDPASQAATLIKSDTTTMNTAADWGGTAPAAGNTGQFDATISAPNAAALTLGGAVALDGLTFLGTMNGPVTVATSASTLTLGTSAGINMSAANFDVTLNCPVSVQTFNVPVGRTITLGGGSSAFLSANISSGLGTVQLTAASAKTFTTSGGTQPVNIGMPSTGVGGLVIGNNCTVNGSTSFEPGTGGNGLVTINGGTLNFTGGNLVAGRNATGNGRVILANGAITVGANIPIIGFQNATGELDVQGGLFSSAGANVSVSSGSTGSAVNDLLFISGGVTLAKEVDFGGGFNSTVSTLGTGRLVVSGGSLYVGSGGILQDGTGTFSSSTSLSGGTVGALTNWSSSLPMTLTNDTGSITFKAADTNGNPFNITLSGALTGLGGLNKSGGGTLTLNAVNAYSGLTIITNGTFTLGASASIANTPVISVGNGATFDISALGSFNLGSSQVLSNNASTTGALNGNLNTGSGTVSVTFAAGTPAFNVTNGTLTLSVSTVFNLNNTGSTLTPGSYKIISKATTGNAGAVA